MTAGLLYTLRVLGLLDDHWGTWFGESTLEHHGDGTSTITVVVADQAELHGVLARVRDVGAPLLELHLETPSATTELGAERVS